MEGGTRDTTGQVSFSKFGKANDRTIIELLNKRHEIQKKQVPRCE